MVQVCLYERQTMKGNIKTYEESFESQRIKILPTRPFSTNTFIVITSTMTMCLSIPSQLLCLTTQCPAEQASQRDSTMFFYTITRTFRSILINSLSAARFPNIWWTILNDIISQITCTLICLWLNMWLQKLSLVIATYTLISHNPYRGYWWHK